MYKDKGMQEFIQANISGLQTQHLTLNDIIGNSNTIKQLNEDQLLYTIPAHLDVDNLLTSEADKPLQWTNGMMEISVEDLQERKVTIRGPRGGYKNIGSHG